MKLTDDEKYQLGYNQGYYDALESMSEDVNRKKNWALMNLTDKLTDTIESEEDDESNTERD